MDQSRALAEASRFVSIGRHGHNQWVIYHPWKNSDRRGPNTATNPINSYYWAQKRKALIVADLALWVYFDEGRGFDDWREWYDQGYHAMNRVIDDAGAYQPITARQLLSIGVKTVKMLTAKHEGAAD
jgi:hypothetical protein